MDINLTGLSGTNRAGSLRTCGFPFESSTVHSTMPCTLTLIPVASPPRLVNNPALRGLWMKSLASFEMHLLAPESQTMANDSSGSISARALNGAIRAAVTNVSSNAT